MYIGCTHAQSAAGGASRFQAQGFEKLLHRSPLAMMCTSCLHAWLCTCIAVLIYLDMYADMGACVVDMCSHAMCTSANSSSAPERTGRVNRSPLNENTMGHAEPSTVLERVARITSPYCNDHPSSLLQNTELKTGSLGPHLRR